MAEVRDVKLRITTLRRRARVVYLPAYVVDYTFGSRFNQHGERTPERFQAVISGMGELLQCDLLCCALLPCHALPCPALPCLPCPVLSCPVLSCPVLSCVPVPYSWLCGSAIFWAALPCSALPCTALTAQTAGGSVATKLMSAVSTGSVCKSDR